MANTGEWEDQAAANALAEGDGTAVSGNPIDNMPVFMKRFTEPAVVASEDVFATAAGAEPREVIPTVLEVSNEYFMWDERKKEEFRSRIKMAGLDPTRLSDTQLAGIWRGYVEQAAQYRANGTNRTPDEVIGYDMIAHERMRLEEIEKKAQQGPVTTTSIQQSTDMSTKLDAKALLYTAARTLLGRAPSESETGNFFAALNAEEAANPTRTTTVSTTTPGTDAEGMQIDQQQTQTQTTEGGVSADAKSMLAMDAAKANPEYGAYQAGTKVHDAFMDLVYGKGY